MPTKKIKDGMKIALSSDHGGFELKQELINYFEKKDYRVKDLGPATGDKPVSYSKMGKKLGKYVTKHDDTLGIVICGTGIGISIAANRVKGVRAARITSIADAKMAKKHNNANVLAIGGRITSTKKAVDMFNSFVREDFEGGRHIKRIEDLDK